MSKGLSERQEQMLRFILAYIRKHDYPPSIREIQDGLDISSTSVVDYNLKALERKGYIRRTPEQTRSIEVIGRRRMVSVPIYGTIEAGQPITMPSAEWWRRRKEEAY